MYSSMIVLFYLIILKVTLFNNLKNFQGLFKYPKQTEAKWHNLQPGRHFTPNHTPSLLLGLNIGHEGGEVSWNGI